MSNNTSAWQLHFAITMNADDTKDRSQTCVLLQLQLEKTVKINNTIDMNTNMRVATVTAWDIS